jgi:hypothetical protein
MLINLLSFASLGAGAAAPFQLPADSGAFIVRLGHDTIAIERFVRRGTRIEATAVSRSPRTAVARLALTLAPDGSVATIGVARGPAPVQEQAPPVAGAIPLTGGFQLPWELALRRVVTENRDSTLVALLAGGNPRPTVFRRTAAGQFTFLSQFDQGMRARVDPAGRLLALTTDGGGTTVERVGWLDVDAMARAFAARDSAGRGLGPLSPRDTVSAEVRGARIMVTYGRPSLRGRPLDVLVPPGQVWRAGSNDATTITTDRSLAFQGTTLPPGTYSLFVLADPGGWTLILNRLTGMSGLDRNPAQDLGRVLMTTRTTAPSTERFTIEVRSRDAGGALALRWGTVEALAPFTVAP